MGSKRVSEDQSLGKRTRTKHSTSKLNQMDDAQFESLLPPPILRRPRPEHNAKAMSGLAQSEKRAISSVPLKFCSTSLQRRDEQPQAVASGSGYSSRTSADHRPSAPCFWHHGHAQLYAFPSRIFNPVFCTVLDLEPGDYRDALPVEGDAAAHAAFVKAQTCIPGCDFFDDAGRKRASSLMEHLQTCYKRRRLFDPRGRVDSLARLARFQLAALNGEQVAPSPASSPFPALSNIGATFAPTTRPETRIDQAEAARKAPIIPSSQKGAQDTASAHSNTSSSAARPLNGLPVFDPHRPPRELPPLTATPVFSHQVLTSLNPSLWNEANPKPARCKDGKRVADRPTAALPERRRAPSQPDPPRASASSAASTPGNFYNLQFRPRSTSGGPAPPDPAPAPSPHPQLPRRAEPVFHWRRVYPAVAAASIPALQQGYFECSFCGQPATPPTAPVEKGLALVGHHDVLVHICQCKSIGEARAPILRLFGGPPLARRATTSFASEGLLNQGRILLQTPRHPTQPAVQTPAISPAPVSKAVLKKKEPRAPSMPAKASAKAVVTVESCSTTPEARPLRKEPTRLSVRRHREMDSDDGEDRGRTRHGGLGKLAPVPAPKREAVRKAVLCSAADDQLPNFFITVWGDASLHPRVSYRSEEFSRVLRPVSVAHTSTANSVVSSHAFVVPRAAVEAQGRLSVALASDGLRVPDECNVLLEKGMLQLEVRDGDVKWKLAGQLRL